MGLGAAFTVTTLLVIWFNNSPSTTLLDPSIYFLIEMSVFSSICFDITNAMKQMRIWSFIGCSLK